MSDVIVNLVALLAYTGNASFAARQAAWYDANGQRFFVNRNGWADIRYGSIAAFQKLGVEFRPGGSAASKLQVRWTEENLARLGYAFPGNPVEIEKGSSSTDMEAFILKIAASK